MWFRFSRPNPTGLKPEPRAVLPSVCGPGQEQYFLLFDARQHGWWQSQGPKDGERPLVTAFMHVIARISNAVHLLPKKLLEFSCAKISFFYVIRYQMALRNA